MTDTLLACQGRKVYVKAQAFDMGGGGFSITFFCSMILEIYKENIIHHEMRLDAPAGHNMNAVPCN